MYRPPNLTDEQFGFFKEAICSSDRKWSIKLTMDLDDGTHLDLYEKDIKANSVVFKEQSTCTSGIMVGSTFANSLDFCLLNGDSRFRNYNFNKAVVTAMVSLFIPKMESFAEIKLGTFIVLEAGKKNTTIPIKCMDKMCLLNRNLSDTNPIFPINLRILFEKVCELGTIIHTSELYEQIPNIAINEFDASKVTCRDFIAYIGYLIGKNIRMSRVNQLESFWYSDEVYTTTPDTRTNITLNDLNICPTSVVIKDWSGEEYVTQDSDTTQQITFETNPLIQNEEVAISVLAKLTTLFTTIQYSTYDCQFIGDPCIQAGDFVSHTMVVNEQQSAKTINSIIMAHEYKFRGLGKISALGKAPEEDRQLTATAKKILDVQIKSAKDLNDGLTSVQQVMVKQSNLLTESLGLYCGTKYNADGTLAGYYMASENIFSKDGIINFDNSNVDDRTDCYVWAYGAGGIGVSDEGYFGVYSGFTKDKSIVAKMVIADWIRTGTLSSMDDTINIDLSSGKQTLTAKDGWGQTVMDGIGTLFTYWNKNVTTPQTNGHPLMAYLKITADADELESTDEQIAADLKLVWSSEKGKMYTSMGHTILHAPDGTEIDDFETFEIQSTAPIHISPSIYYDESLLFDNIIMRRTNSTNGNTGVDFVIEPHSRPVVPIPDGQVNLLSNPGFEDGTLSPWVTYYGGWRTTTSLVYSGSYSIKSMGMGDDIACLNSAEIAKLGLYSNSVYVGFWSKMTEFDGRFFSTITLSETNGDRELIKTFIKFAIHESDWQYNSIIIPKLDNKNIICLNSSGYYKVVVDDLCVYEAKNYSKEQWDDYVLRGAK